MLRYASLAGRLAVAALFVQGSTVEAARANYPVPPGGIVRIGSFLRPRSNLRDDRHAALRQKASRQLDRAAKAA